MKKDDRHKYDTGARVKTFFTERPQLIPSGSKTLDIVNALIALLAVIFGLRRQQEAAISRWDKANEQLGLLRDLVTTDAGIIVRTLRSLAAEPPEVAAKFRVRKRSAQDTLAAGQALLDHARTMTADLAAQSLPEAFLTAFEGRLAALDAGIAEQNSARDVKQAATAQVESQVRALMKTLKELDVIARNLFRGDQAMLDAWRKARHIETGPTPAAADDPAPAPPAAPEGTKVA